MNAITMLRNLGTSTWLDDLSRERIHSGNLAELIQNPGILGVTTNPAIFAAAISKGESYDEQIASLREQGLAVDKAVYELCIADVRDACDAFKEVFESTNGFDGRVSIEVDPRISDDANATLAQAKELWERIDRENLMIKIPATPGSLPAITAALAAGISVNVTLIFSLARYQEVIDAYIAGIQQAAAAGKDVSKIHSVASFFVSRLDTEVDKRLEALGTEDATALLHKAGIANAQAAYGLFQDSFARAELPAGANVQRPLWASTGVKDPALPADSYVVNLAGPNTVNTMPEATITATVEGNNVVSDTLSNADEKAHEVLETLTKVGIDLDDVFDVLEREGVEKFVAAWNELLDTMQQRLS